MARRWLAVLALGVGIALSGPVSGEARGGDYWERCGDQGVSGASWFHLRAHDITCHGARKATNMWWDNGGNVDAFDGWRCTVKSLGYELGSTDCKRSRNGKFQRIKFKHGS